MRKEAAVLRADAHEPELGDMQTRERIMRAAERLFAQHGYSGVSLRTIMAEAGANTAAVHYYFRSKEGLMRAIFAMRTAPMNEERRALFDDYEKAAAKRGPSIRHVLEAFVGPAIRRARAPEGVAFEKISALCSVDPNPSVRRIVFEAYRDVAPRFVRLLRAACRHLSDSAFYWRLHCFYGSMTYVRAQNGRVAELLGDTESDASAEVVTEQLVAFVEAGFQAREGADAQKGRAEKAKR